MPNDAIAVRGGDLAGRNWLEVLIGNAASVFLETGGEEGGGLRGVCGGAAPLPTTGETVAIDMPYRGDWYGETTVGALRGEGFDVVMVDEPPHCVLLLNSDDLGRDWEGWERFRSVFTIPQRIPHASGSTTE